MNTDTFHYHVNRTQREETIRAARRNHLIRVAVERRPKTQRAYTAALLTLWQSLFR